MNNLFFERPILNSPYEYRYQGSGYLKLKKKRYGAAATLRQGKNWKYQAVRF